MKTLNIMALDFTYKAAIKGYESVILHRIWNGIGSLELIINSEIPNAKIIGENDILWFDNEYHKAFIVEHIESKFSGNVMSFQIKANHLNVLLHDFITIPPVGMDTDTRTGTREEVVRSWVTQNCISPDDPGRGQYPITLSTYEGLGDAISEQTRFSVLSDEIRRILIAEDLGYLVDLDLGNEQFVVRVLAGVNRTSLQSENGRILFGLKYGNISGFRKVHDVSAAKTVAYVGGQGEGSTREVTQVDRSLGGRRKEVFVDASNTETSAELTERAHQVLVEAASVNSFEFEILNRQFEYERDFELGDFVTVVQDTEILEHLQVKEVKEVYEKGNIRVTPVFGVPEKTLGGVFGNVSKNISELSQSSTRIDDSKTSASSTWSSERISGIGGVPVGTINAYAASLIPSGWFECDGSEINRTQYSDLFSVLGTIYGAGNGTTTFNLPNLKGRVVVGLNSADTEFTSLAQTGGEKTHTISTSEMPAHTHDIKMSTDSSPDGGSGATASEDSFGRTLEEGAMTTGGGEPHNNLQPYMVLKWMIKY